MFKNLKNDHMAETAFYIQLDIVVKFQKSFHFVYRKRFFAITTFTAINSKILLMDSSSC